MPQKGSPLHRLTQLHIRLFQNIPADEMRITVPTLLTITRMLLVPCIIASMFVHAWGWAFIFFCVGAWTDFLDGSLARYLHQKTFLGACLDPIADKLLLVSFFLALVFLPTPLFQLPLWFVLLVLAREAIVVCGAFFILVTGRHLDIQPTMIGKLTTVMQMMFIIWLFACYYFQWMPIKTYYGMLVAMVVLTMMSCGQYMRIGLKHMGMWCIVFSILCSSHISEGETFIKSFDQQKSKSLRSIKHEYGTLFTQQLHLSTSILKELGTLQGLLIRIDVPSIEVLHKQKMYQALIALDEQLAHLHMVATIHEPSIRTYDGATIQECCAFMVEHIATIQSLLVRYIEQLIAGDADLFCKKKHADLEAHLIKHRSDAQAMQSLLELLQQLQKECKVVQNVTISTQK